MHFFFSDAHLGLGQPAASRQREQAVLRFLRMVGEQRAQTLFIVGDLFDYWFDYRTVIPRQFVRTLSAIAELVEAGTRVEYVIGNHDFGHRDFFQNELGVAVHTGDLATTIAGRRCYISHGDGKAFNDTGYLILKKILRARISNILFRAVHPDLGIGLAMWASQRSRDYTSQKNYGAKGLDAEQPGESDGLYAFAQKKITQEGFQLVVMGHSHVPRRVELEGGTYINLGAWLKDRYYLQLSDEGLIFQPFTLL
ncbi:MAG: UDP-2,3-diacylglucosamine diphosphatase [Chlorobi bacterium]|nr:UDP-2,3-diacylglucosamine diphosphatase [Chlorobiota bacterium]